jgi:eukaryotic translation initiation factor 2C
VSPTNQEYRITGLSENTCKEQMLVILILCYFCPFAMLLTYNYAHPLSFFHVLMPSFPKCRFSLKSRASDGNDVESVDITVYYYFVNHRSIDLRYSGDLPCINVGKPKRPTYIPVEVTRSFSFFPLSLPDIFLC